MRRLLIMHKLIASLLALVTATGTHVHVHHDILHCKVRWIQIHCLAADCMAHIPLCDTHNSTSCAHVDTLQWLMCTYVLRTCMGVVTRGGTFFGPSTAMCTCGYKRAMCTCTVLRNTWT